MSKTHFSRFREGVQISGVEMNVHQKGKVFYVNNSSVPSRPGQLTGSNSNNGLSPETPFSTLDYAIGQCVANRGDKIIVGPGHAETVSGATTIAMDVAGISIIGTGEGDQKPTFTFSATGSNIAVSAANISMCHLKFIASASSVTAGVTVSASGFRAYDMETADTDATHCFAITWQTTSGGDNCKIQSKHKGFAASSVGTRYVDVVGCRDGEFNIDYFGNCSTSVVDMRTTACDNIRVFGTFYNDNAALTKNVTNNTTSTWSVEGYDAKAGRHFAGSDDLAVHYTDSSVSAETALGTDGTTTTDGAATIYGAMLALPRCVASAAKTLGAGDTTMFTISGGPIKVLELVGIVTTVVQSQATSTKITMTTTSPAATVDFSAAAVDLTGAAAGSSIRHINTTGILTVVAAGFVMEGNAFATNDTQYLVPAGTLKINNASAANTGAITWYLRYVPLSPLSRVA